MCLRILWVFTRSIQTTKTFITACVGFQCKSSVFSNALFWRTGSRTNVSHTQLLKYAKSVVTVHVRNYKLVRWKNRGRKQNRAVKEHEKNKQNTDFILGFCRKNLHSRQASGAKQDTEFTNCPGNGSKGLNHSWEGTPRNETQKHSWEVTPRNQGCNKNTRKET